MATFEEHIEGLTQVDITTTSAPSQSELTGFLVDGVIDCVNKILKSNPNELSKFTKTTNAVDSVAKKGKILSVLREHDSTIILRVCTPIPPQLRYEATDTKSLHYRSKYNPGYYELNGLIICVPPATGTGNNDIVVTQVHYDTGLINSDEYNGGVIENFPLEYEYLIALYAAAQTCHTAAGDIQNNMPTKPNPPVVPDFPNIDAEIPAFPVVSSPELYIDFSKVNQLLAREDLEGVDKALNIIDKEFEVFKQKFEIEKVHNARNDGIFKTAVDRLVKDADRDLSGDVAEFKHSIEKYKEDVSFYNSKLSEQVQKYKWHTEQYINFVNQYTAGIMSTVQPAPKKQKQPNRRKGER